MDKEDRIKFPDAVAAVFAEARAVASRAGFLALIARTFTGFWERSRIAPDTVRPAAKVAAVIVAAVGLALAAFLLYIFTRWPIAGRRSRCSKKKIGNTSFLSQGRFALLP